MIFALLGFRLANANVGCPDKLNTDKIYSSCSDFCNDIGQKAFSDYQIISMGSIFQNFDSYCSCVFRKPYNNNPDLGEKSVFCQYKIVKNTANTTSVNQQIFSSNIPRAMISLAVFDKGSVTLDLPGPAGIVFNGLYTVYTNVVHSIASTVALLLLVIISGWNLGIVVFSRLIRKLESGSGDFSQMVSTYWKSKAMMVIPAAVFFSLPVPQSNFIFKNANVGISSNNYTQNSCEKITKQISDLNNQINDLNNQIQVLDQQIATQTDESTKQELIDQRNGLISQRDNLQLQLQNLNDSKNDVCNSTITTSTTNNKSLIQTNPLDIKVPLAIAMVKGFVMTGMGYGERVSDMAGAYIMSYVATKVSEANAITQNVNNQLNQEYEKALKEMKQSFTDIQSQAGSCLAGSSGGDLCGFYTSMSEDQKAEKINNDSNCKYYYAVIEEQCARYNEVVTQLGSSNNNNTATAYQSISSTIAPIKGALGILYPAVIPQASAYSFLKNIQEPGKYKITASLTKSYSTDNTDEIFDPVDYASKVWGKVKGVYDTAKSVLGTVYNTAKGFTSDAVGEIPTNAGLGFVLGQAMIITAIPPGKEITNWLMNILTAIPNIAGKMGILIAGVPLITGNVLLAGAISILSQILASLLKVGTKILAVFIGYGITMMILKLIPFMIVSFALISRFLSYFLEVLKFVITLPFFAVAVATNQPGQFAEFFKKLIRLMLTPTLIAFAPLVVFTAIELSFLLFFDIPTYVILNLIPPSFFANFLAGAISAFIYLVATFITIVISWQLSFSLIEGIFEYLNQFIGSTSSSAIQSMQAVNRVIEKRIGSNLL
jgi:peptidoglycan hydrolase CwlO-like protein